MKSKVFASSAEAVRDIPDGAVIAFGGFSAIGSPANLLQALADQGAKNLTCVLNSPRNSPNLPAAAPTSACCASAAGSRR